MNEADPLVRNSVTVERDISAPAETVWSLVADVTRMGEWSPETVSCEWLDDATRPAIGVRFRGFNDNGRRAWSTPCIITDCVPGLLFGFDVKPSPFPVQAHWQYRLESTATGCHVTETSEDLRSRLGAWLGDRISGTHDRHGRNLETMTATLERLARAAESDDK